MRVFYATLALTPYETEDIARALGDLPVIASHVHAPVWAPAPAERLPDIYITHLRCVDLGDDDVPAAVTSNRYIQRVQLDDEGHYRQRPVCLLGEEESAHQEWRYSGAQDSRALAQALEGDAQARIDEVMRTFELTRKTMLLRAAWRTHHIFWHVRNRRDDILAAVLPQQRQAWIRSDCHARDMALAQPLSIKHTNALPLDFAASGYEHISFWELLWDYVQRCTMPQIHSIVPARYWPRTLHAHRPAHLRAARAEALAEQMVDAVQKRQGSKQEACTVQDVLEHTQGQCAPEEALRTLAGLLLVRALRLQGH